PRAIEGGTDGRLTIAATMAKRRAIAASIRQDADHLNNPDNPLPEMLRRMESLVYEKDQPTVKKVNDLAEQYISALEKLDAAPLAAKKDEVKNVKGDFDYLVKFNILPATFEPKVQVEQIIKNQGWDKKK
ncbi:MAG: DUF1080 domain-containing protein, partial [Candidatus Omnitrophica bacterium]|nr:DUF1080 domain-containing protein [Candidatus Omnitrophota bacterium]